MIRIILLGLTLLLFAPCSYGQNADRLNGSSSGENTPLVGAIYWGMWDSYGFGAPAQTEVTLSPADYRYRVPFFGRESTERVVSYYAPPGVTRHTATTSLRINADKQWIIDQEIKYAVNAGINYFAYVYYGKYHYSHRLYKSSKVPEKEKLKLAWIIAPLNQDELADVVEDMGKDYYQTVMGGRPLLYYIMENNDCLYVTDLLKRLREEYRSQYPSGPQPYIVILKDTYYLGHYCPDTKEYFADAFGAYTSLHGGSVRDHSYEYIRDHEITGWANGDLGPSGQKRVLWMSLGHDRRPRIDFPVSWERTAEGNADPGNSLNWAASATPVQITEQLNRALGFIRSHPETCEARSLLIYAWNEHDEGGWISPTLVPGTNEINRNNLLAVKKALNPDNCTVTIPTPLLSHETPVVIPKGESLTLTATCTSGTPVWNNGSQGRDLRVTDTRNTTYQVKCVSGACESNERFIDVKITEACETRPFTAALLRILPENAALPKYNSNHLGEPMRMNGTDFTDIYESGVGSLSGTELTFDLGEDHGYGFLTGVVGLDDKTPCKDKKIRFYLRDWTSMDFLYTSPEIFFNASGKSNLDTFRIDIRNIRYLRMDAHSENMDQTCALVNWSLLKLECPPDCDQDVPPVLKADKTEITEGDSVTLTATCPSGTLYWSDGKSDSVRVFSPARTTAYTARCKTFGCDGSLNATPVSITVNVNCAIPNAVDYYKAVTHPSRIKINQSISGGKIRLLDSSGTIKEYAKGFSVSGPLDIHFDLDQKREFHYFKVTVGIDPADSCSQPVRFRIMNMVEKEDLLTSPLIYPPGKGTPNSYAMEVPVAWMQWFNLQVLLTDSTDSCGIYNWADPRYECYSDRKEILLPNERENLEVIPFPNPSDGRFNLAFGVPLSGLYQLTITDISGREVFGIQKTTPGTHHLEVDASHLAAGNYFISIKNRERRFRAKLVVTE